MEARASRYALQQRYPVRTNMLSGEMPKSNIPALLVVDDPGQTRAERSGVAESISVEVRRKCGR